MTTTIIKGNVTFNIDDNLDPSIKGQMQTILDKLYLSRFSNDIFTVSRTINVLPETGGSHSDSGNIYLDPADWNGAYYINLNGGKSAYEPDHVFTHELVHIVRSKQDPVDNVGDPVLTSNQLRDLVGDPNSDLLGGALRYMNPILKEVFGEAERGNYFEAYIPSNQSLYTQTAWQLFSNPNFTFGERVDDVLILTPIGVAEGWVVDRRGPITSELIVTFDGSQTVYGGGGNDYIYSGAGNDLVSGGADVDHIQGNEGDDILIGGNSISTPPSMNFNVYHSDWDDQTRDFISGGDDNDMILSASSAESSDYFFDVHDRLKTPSDLTSLLSKIDYIDGSDDEYVAHVQYGGSGSFFYYYSWTAETMQSAATSGATFIPFGPSTNFINGASEASWDVNGVRLASETLGNVLLLTSIGAAYNQQLIAGVTNVLTRDLSASAGAWLVDGTDNPGAPLQKNLSSALITTGADTLYGGNTQDSISAYGGDDTIILGQYSGGLDYVDGGTGVDTVSYVGTSTNLTISIANVANGSADGLGSGKNDTLVGIENIISGSGNDTLTGSSLANTIDGGAGADTVSGGAGADVLIGGAGADSLSGNAGTDTYYIDNAGDVVTELAAEGVDIVYSTVSHALGGNVENLVLQGSATDGTGNNVANTITGNSSNNRLDGGAGADVLTGGTGNDTYVVDNSNDIVTELAGQGVDLIQASISITALAANVENLTFNGTAALDGAGNGLDNIINGNNGANSLSGGNGADTITAKNGADTLSGGGGNDVLNSGFGNDEITGGGGSDSFIFDLSTDGYDSIMDFSDGVDKITITGTSMTSWSQLQNFVSESGGDCFIQAYPGTQIAVHNIQVSQLSNADFIFA